MLGHRVRTERGAGVFARPTAAVLKVLYRDENTAPRDWRFDPADPSTVFAGVGPSRQGAVEVGPAFPGDGHRPSTDGGTDLARQVRTGLPTCARRPRPDRDHGTPSEPAADTPWSARTGRQRALPLGRRRGNWHLQDCRRAGHGPRWRLQRRVRVDPQDADVRSPTVVTWKSTDGGRAPPPWRAPPGHNNYGACGSTPTPSVMILSSARGAWPPSNDGRTWSSWYNQPTAQFYTSPPRRVPVPGLRRAAGERLRGALSRANDGQITFREWHPVLSTGTSRPIPCIPASCTGTPFYCAPVR